MDAASRGRAAHQVHRNRWCDCIRGYAILLVCVAHSFYLPFNKNENLQHYFKGDTGVFMFYVLSGFLVTAIIERETSQRSGDRWRPVASFYARRVFRLQPGLILFLCIYLLLPRPESALAPWMLVLPVSNWAAGPYITWHLKTLHVEESYYIVIGLLAVLVRELRTCLWAVGITTAVLRVGLFLFGRHNFEGAWWIDRLPPIEPFVVGGLFALYFEQMRQTPIWRTLTSRPFLLFGSSLSLLLVVGVLRYVKPFSYLLISTWPSVFSLLSAATVASGVEQQRLWFAPEWLRKVGVASYTIYLFQQFLLAPWKMTYGTTFWLPGWLMLLAAAAAGIPFWYRYAEMPLTNLGARLFPRIAAAVPAKQEIAEVIGTQSPGLPPMFDLSQGNDAEPLLR